MSRVQIKEVFSLQMGKTPSRKNYEYWTDGDIDWVSIRDLGTYDRYVEGTKERITQLAVDESGIKQVPPNTLIMSFKLSLGKTAITVQPTYTNEAIMAFIDKGRYPFDIGYLFHQFSAKDWTAGTNMAVMGATLNKKTLSESWIELPSEEEQGRIAGLFDSVCERIADARGMLDTLDELVKSRFVEMFGDPVDNKEGWQTVPLKDACMAIGDGLHGTPEYVEDSAIAFINGTNLDEGAIRITPATRYVSEETYERHYIEMGENTILLSINGTLGRLAFFNNERVMLGKSACYINLKPSINKFFVYNLMKSDAFLRFMEENASKSTIKNVGLKAIRSFPLIMPPLELQAEFVLLAQQVDKLKFETQQAIDKLQMLYDSLAQEYFAS